MSSSYQPIFVVLLIHAGNSLTLSIKKLPNMQPDTVVLTVAWGSGRGCLVALHTDQCCGRGVEGQGIHRRSGKETHPRADPTLSYVRKTIQLLFGFSKDQRSDSFFLGKKRMRQ